MHSTKSLALYLGSALMGASLLANPLWAQEQAWLQIEAQPSLAQAQDRATAYAGLFPDVVGYTLNAKWWGIALGPYPVEEARVKLRELRDQGMIPSDSYVTDGRNFGTRYWPDSSGGYLGESVPPAISGAAPLDGTGLSAGLDAMLTPLPDPAPEDDIAPIAPLDPIQSAPLNGDLPATSPDTPAAPDVLMLPDATVTPLPPQAPVQSAPAPIAESLDQSRTFEAALPASTRMDIQRALAWHGIYGGGIDGAFGKGSRTAIAQWQQLHDHEQTGILSRAQQQELLSGWQADIATLGFAPLREEDAGIAAELPLGLVEFDGYHPPFVLYQPHSPQGPQIALISRQGDGQTLAQLYDSLQADGMIPPQGPRALNAGQLSISGSDAKRQAFAVARLSQGRIKGYVVSWAATDPLGPRIAQQLDSSFTDLGAKTLDIGMVALSASDRQALNTGLDQPSPKREATGFYLDGAGHVATSLAAVQDCRRITLDNRNDARLLAQDRAKGIAFLTPATPLAPSAFARFTTAAPAVGDTLSVSGYAYGSRLPAPVLTRGLLAELGGLAGEAHLNRLSITTMPSDAGGALLDGAGAVQGILLPQSDPARSLPQGTGFALAAQDLQQAMTAAGITPSPLIDPVSGPDALHRQAISMTTLVGCWD